MKQILIVRVAYETSDRQGKAYLKQMEAFGERHNYAVLVCTDQSLKPRNFRFSTLSPAAELSPEQMEKLKVLLESVTLPEEKQEEGERPLQ